MRPARATKVADVVAVVRGQKGNGIPVVLIGRIRTKAGNEGSTPLVVDVDSSANLRGAQPSGFPFFPNEALAPSLQVDAGFVDVQPGESMIIDRSLSPPVVRLRVPCESGDGERS